MKKPRCGMPDDVAARSRVRRYKTGSKWRKTHLTYFIQHGRDLPHSQQDRIFQRALQYWADVSGLSFSRSSSSNADLKIRWEDVKEKNDDFGISHDNLRDQSWSITLDFGRGVGGFDDKKSIKGDYRKLTANLLQRGGGVGERIIRMIRGLMGASNKFIVTQPKSSYPYPSWLLKFC